MLELYVMLKIGDSAPTFSLPDQNGNFQTLTDYVGKWVLVYFYPKDDTPGCTKEACTIRDNWDEFEKQGIIVLGISTDTVESHKKFAEKYKLPFTLLSDGKKIVVDLYEVWQAKKFMGREYMGTLRQSFLVNPEGKITNIYREVKPEKHAQEILADKQRLTG